VLTTSASRPRVTGFGLKAVGAPVASSAAIRLRVLEAVLPDLAWLAADHRERPSPGIGVRTTRIAKEVM
jgi:hypothetical protein